MPTKAELVFEEELNYIEDRAIRDFVVHCFDKLTPEYFWSSPASTTGKYHPEISLGDGGLVRHVKYAVWWGIELAACWPDLGEISLDEIIAALLLHDLMKNGEKLDKRGYPTLKNSTGTHGPYLGEKIKNLIGEDEKYNGLKTVSRIISAIEGHMGFWTDPAYDSCQPDYQSDQDTRTLCNLVHTADYCASRKADQFMKELHFNPDQYRTMYAIGQEDESCGMGFWDGPTPDLDYLIKESGRDDKSVIVEFNKVNGDKPLYRWSTQMNDWTPFV